MDSKKHWEDVYTTKSSDSVSWFQPNAEKSLGIIQGLDIAKNSNVIDIGGGASTLVDDLLQHGYLNLSVLDLSAAALEVAKSRLGSAASKVQWREEDVTKLTLEKHSVDVWHDRAVFHFLTNEDDRNNYVKSVLHAVKPGGYVIVATFAEDGPEECSGLPVQRYSASELHSQFGSPFTLLGHEKEIHKTPFGTTQSFVYCYCRKE
ncbi:MAG: class I SAM-dependent methyltransferase [Oleispira sp.]|nr:class I SAM-dependent methyltransferase [Oleispira sp.]